MILPSSCTATAAQCASAIAFLQKQMDVLVTRNVHSAMGFGKIDWNLSPRNTFSFDLNAMHWASPHGIQTQSVLTSGNLLGNNGNSTVETRYGKASWTAIASSNIVNEFRFGWFKDRLSDPAASDLWPAETGPLTVTIAGSNVGAANAYPRTLPSENRFQFVENLSWISGAHSAKFGVDTQTTHDWMNQLFRGAGEYTYSSLTNFARDFSRQCRWSEELLQLSAGLRKSDSRVQNLGHQPVRSRYVENQPPVYPELWSAMGKGFPASAHKERPDASGVDLTQPNYPQTGVIPSDNHNFAPRLSLSYSINDKTVVRAGYGLFYARIHGQLLDTLYLGASKYQATVFLNSTQTGAPVFPNAFSASTGLPLGALSLQFAAKNFYNPYTEQGSLAVERQLTRDLGLTVSYLWSKGIGLVTQNDLNLGPPGPIRDLPDQGCERKYRQHVHDPSLDCRQQSRSELQQDSAGRKRRPILVQRSRGSVEQTHFAQHHGKIAYTWSHAIEDGNEQGASWNISSTFNNATYPGNYRFDKGSSALDQRHRASDQLGVAADVYEEHLGHCALCREWLGSLRHRNDCFRAAGDADSQRKRRTVPWRFASRTRP